MRLVYISHPEVAVDPASSPPDWGLSARGIARATGLALRGLSLPQPRLIASPERKAQDCALVLGHHWGLAFDTHPAMGEVDRSATGYLPADQHEALADQLFTHPTRSAAGWERAVDAQVRVLTVLEDLCQQPGNLILIGHGGVGSLLWCALARQPISRRADQPGQGHIWQMAFDPSPCPLHPWQSFETTRL